MQQQAEAAPAAAAGSARRRAAAGAGPGRGGVAAMPRGDAARVGARGPRGDAAVAAPLHVGARLRPQLPPRACFTFPCASWSTVPGSLPAAGLAFVG